MNAAESRGRAFDEPKKGVRNDGVRTVEDLRLRCRIDDETGCWVWACGTDGGGAPALWFPPLQKRTSLGVALCFMLTGKAPRRGNVWHHTCGNTLCANPKHHQAGTRRTQMLAAKRVRSPMERARMAAGKRAGSRISDAQCAEIRSSTEPLRVFADRFGISISHASDIRRGTVRKPLAAPGSSIFNLA